MVNDDNLVGGLIGIVIFQGNLGWLIDLLNLLPNISHHDLPSRGKQ